MLLWQIHCESSVVYLVDLLNVEWNQVTAGPQTKPSDLGKKYACVYCCCSLQTQSSSSITWPEILTDVWS